MCFPAARASPDATAEPIPGTILSRERTLFWHDYETFGADPRRDRPAQFAGIRTNEDLEIVGEPVTLYCRPADDVLPSPEACLVTGITPAVARERGVAEPEFIARVHAELARPGTCGTGYNSLRFDDEVTRFTLFRNFFDPFAREWQNGNSRWDIIDMVRMTYALRPEGIEWPLREDGTPSFRLEDLTAANGIEHEGAHDAMVDVYATIELARLVRARQPRLYRYLFDLRRRRQVEALIDIPGRKPLVHTSRMYPAAHGCTALVAPLAAHPTNPRGVLVFDLRFDPTPLLELEVDDLQWLMFMPADQRTEDMPRIPIKTLATNKCPAVSPAGTLTDAAARRLDMDLDAHRRHWRMLAQADGLEEKVAAIFAEPPGGEPEDVELSLYSGGFLSDADRARSEAVRETPPAELGRRDFGFEDPRLDELLFRYRARNYPETLTAAESERWQALRRARLTDPEAGGGITLNAFRERLEALRNSDTITGPELVLLEELENDVEARVRDL